VSSKPKGMPRLAMHSFNYAHFSEINFKNVPEEFSAASC
jgi:hypothetical protein